MPERGAAATMRLLLLLCLCLLCLNLASLVPPASAGSAPAPSAPSSAPAPAAQQGEEELLQNWSLVSTIVPAPPSAVAFARPTSVAEVQAVVADATGKFPSPVLAVGSGHSSGDVVSVVDPSDGAFRGTILQMTEINGMALEEAEVVAGGTAAGRRRRLRSGGSGSSGSLRRRRLEGAAATATAEKKYYVRVGGGVVLADLHDWLAERQLEISFSPEIGDATVGSSASATMKDSSVRGSEPGEEQPGVTYPPYPPSSVFKGLGDGHLAPLVRGLRYVNASGALVDLDARRSPAEASRVRALGGSYGLMGPVVDVLLETRPLALVDVRLKIVPQGHEQSDSAFVQELLNLRNEADNILALISLGGVASSGSTVEVDPTFKKPWAYVELRTRLRGADAQRVPLYNKLAIDWWWPALIRQVKYDAFFQGSIPQYLLYLSRFALGPVLLGGKVAAIRDRRFFVNRYGPATAGKPRLSFSYYELDVSQLPAALPAMLALASDFRGRTGWAPGALAIYFVKRDGVQGESNYGGPPGVSCTMDPVTGAPDDPRFKQFLAESDALLQNNFGAMLSPSQSLPSAIGPGQATNFGSLDQSLISEQRFATPYLKRVWAADALWHATHK